LHLTYRLPKHHKPRLILPYTLPIRIPETLPECEYEARFFLTRVLLKFVLVLTILRKK
jgi:hypothetical protein